MTDRQWKLLVRVMIMLLTDLLPKDKIGRFDGFYSRVDRLIQELNQELR